MGPPGGRGERKHESVLWWTRDEGTVVDGQLLERGHESLILLEGLGEPLEQDLVAQPRGRSHDPLGQADCTQSRRGKHALHGGLLAADAGTVEQVFEFDHGVVAQAGRGEVKAETAQLVAEATTRSIAREGKHKALPFATLLCGHLSCVHRLAALVPSLECIHGHV